MNPRGWWSPGKEYEGLCEEIYQTAKSMINPATGKLAARAVHKTDDIYHGPCRSHMPDIIINWNNEAEGGDSSYSQTSMGSCAATNQDLL